MKPEDQIEHEAFRRYPIYTDPELIKYNSDAETSREQFVEAANFGLSLLAVDYAELNEYKVMAADLHRKNTLLESKITALQSQCTEKDQEIERLKGLIDEYERIENDPYWYWPQCDVDECKGVSCNGGGCWRETGYWSICTKHSTEFREGKPQPKMKQSAIERESRRDKDGYLPSIESENL